MLGTGISKSQLAPAAPAPDHASQQSIAVFGDTMMTASGKVVVDHRPDRLGLLPTDVALMAIWHQCQPIIACFAAHLCIGTVDSIAYRNRSLTIGISAAVDGILDHPVNGGVVQTPPSHIPIVLLYWKFEIMLEKPEQRLASTAKFLIVARKNTLLAGETFPLDRCCHSSNGTGRLAVARKAARRNARAVFSLALEANMPDDKPLKPDDFPLDVEGEKLVTADGKPIAEAKTPAIAEDIASRLNEDDQRREQDRWSA
jgi:hypothetical protein